MNSEAGRNNVLNVPGIAATLSNLLGAPSIRTKTLVLEIFAAICLIDGIEMTLEALELFSSNNEDELHMSFITQFLRPAPTLAVSPDREENRFRELQLATLGLLNAIMGSTDDIVLRIQLRYIWQKAGVYKALQVHLPIHITCESLISIEETRIHSGRCSITPANRDIL